MNEDDKIVIIHEYQTNNQPFLNPICKDTYKALPKIYGNQSNKRYMYKVNDMFKYHPVRFNRQCCSILDHQKQRQSKLINNHRLKRVNTDITWNEETQKKKKFSNNKLRESQFHVNRQKLKTESRIEEITQNRLKMIKKPRKVLLPNLKIFQNQLIEQSESKHKVFTPNRKNQFKMSPFKKIGSNLQEALLENKDRLKKISLKQSETQTQINYEPQPYTKNPLLDNLNSNSKRNSQEYQSTPHLDKIYYDNIPKQQQKEPLQKLQSPRSTKQATRQPTKQEPFAQKTAKKPVKLLKNKPADKDLHIEQQQTNKLTQSQSNTLFHEYKIRYSNINKTAKTRQRNNSITYSVLSNGLFRIPEEDELEDYLVNYKSMNPRFGIEKLVKEPNFNIIPADGMVYFGQIKNDQKHGKGITVTQKQLYQGQYVDNKKKLGCQKNRDGVYSGEFMNGKRHGKGKFVWVNGQTYEGDWRNGKKNGKGIWKSLKGDFYEGEWKQNRQNGTGYHYFHGGSIYRGCFKDFLKQGQGEQQFANGDKYSGEYYHGKPNGFGKYIWKNGDYYEGNFVDGSRDGKGLLIRKLLEKYEGQFKNDLKQGFGKQLLNSGEAFEGIFRQGQRISGKITTKGGRQIYLSQK